MVLLQWMGNSSDKLHLKEHCWTVGGCMSHRWPLLTYKIQSFSLWVFHTGKKIKKNASYFPPKLLWVWSELNYQMLLLYYFVPFNSAKLCSQDSPYCSPCAQKQTTRFWVSNFPSHLFSSRCLPRLPTPKQTQTNVFLDYAEWEALWYFKRPLGYIL